MNIKTKTISNYFLRILSACLAFCMNMFSIQAQSTEEDMLLSDNGFYYRNPAITLNHLNNGDILAAPYLPTSDIVSAKISDGELPRGFSLIPNGMIVVKRSDLVEVGNYTIAITTIDAQENEVTTFLSLEITEPSSYRDNEAMYKMGSDSILGTLSDGEVLAEPIDKDGLIKTAKYVMGHLPPGTQLTPEGKIVVTDHKLLVPNIYNVGIVTVDQREGVTFLIITVPIEKG